MEKTFDINAELERIKRDLSDADEAGMTQITVDFFAGAKNEREFIIAAMAFVKTRGYTCDVEYDDGELLLIIRKIT